MPKKWLPLEINPEIMNKYISTLGVKGDYSFYDVYGFDDDLLAMVPKPCIAVLFLFPVTNENEAEAEALQKKLESEKKFVDRSVFFTKQTIPNACGTIGILHACLNNRNALQLDANGFLSTFYNDALNKDPEQRARLLEEDEQIDTAHATAAVEGSTNAQEAENTHLHFICFTRSEADELVELDGRKQFPIYRGKTSADTLLEDAAKVIQQYMEMNPDSIQFGTVALCKNS